MRNFTNKGCDCFPGLWGRIGITHKYDSSSMSHMRNVDPCKGCLSVHFTVENIIYGSWRSPLQIKDPEDNDPYTEVAVGSFMITGESNKVTRYLGSYWDLMNNLVPEGSEVDYEEEPAYTLESLFSDVGGAAGLALGMSLATFFGALEYLIYRFEQVPHSIPRVATRVY